MGRKIYTAADHQRAFEVWYKTRNWSTVSKALEATWSTTKSWSKATFPCTWSCPWHAYDKLMADRDAALQARMDCLESGDFDPVSHDLAMREAVAKKGDGENYQQNPAPLVIVRADLERMAHWEYLWSKVYFHATGLVTNWREFQGVDAMDAIERLELQDKLRKTLGGGLSATSLDQCIRMLKTIQDQIDGLQGSNRRATSSTAPGKKELTIKELREMRTALKSTPPTKLRTMMKVVDSQDAASDIRAS